MDADDLDKKTIYSLCVDLEQAVSRVHASYSAIHHRGDDLTSFARMVKLAKTVKDLKIAAKPDDRAVLGKLTQVFKLILLRDADYDKIEQKVADLILQAQNKTKDLPHPFSNFVKTYGNETYDILKKIYEECPPRLTLTFGRDGLYSTRPFYDWTVLPKKIPYRDDFSGKDKSKIIEEIIKEAEQEEKFFKNLLDKVVKASQTAEKITIADKLKEAAKKSVEEGFSFSAAASIVIFDALFDAPVRQGEHPFCTVDISDMSKFFKEQGLTLAPSEIKQHLLAAIGEIREEVEQGNAFLPYFPNGAGNILLIDERELDEVFKVFAQKVAFALLEKTPGPSQEIPDNAVEQKDDTAPMQRALRQAKETVPSLQPATSNPEPVGIAGFAFMNDGKGGLISVGTFEDSDLETNKSKVYQTAFREYAKKFAPGHPNRTSFVVKSDPEHGRLIIPNCSVQGYLTAKNARESSINR